MKQLNLFQPPAPDHLKGSIRIGKNDIAVTSILSHREEKAKGKIETLAQKIICLLGENRMMTSRQIANELRAERNSVTAPIKKLESSRKIKITKVAPCPVTGKKVRWYQLENVSE